MCFHNITKQQFKVEYYPVDVQVFQTINAFSPENYTPSRAFFREIQKPSQLFLTRCFTVVVHLFVFFLHSVRAVGGLVCFNMAKRLLTMVVDCAAQTLMSAPVTTQGSSCAGRVLTLKKELNKVPQNDFLRTMKKFLQFQIPIGSMKKPLPQPEIRDFLNL